MKWFVFNLALTLITLKCRLDVRITTLNTEDIKERRKVAQDKLTGDDKATDKQKKQRGLFKWYFWSFGFVLLSVLGYLGFLIYISWPISTYSIDKSALLGDSFGILSSLFSGLAFAGLIVTLVMQRKTLDAQMQELELARQEYKRQGDELAGQKAVMAAQFNAIQLQQFESTFFRLLDEFRLFKSVEKYHFASDAPFKLSSMFNLEVNWMDYSYTKEYMNSERHVWLGYISKISVILRFSYNGYIKDFENNAKVYVELLHGELTQAELFWLILALSYFGSKEDLELFVDTGFLNKFDMRSSCFSLLFSEYLNIDYEKPYNLLIELRKELFDESDYYCALKYIRNSVQRSLDTLVEKSSESPNQCDFLLERLDGLKALAYERFNLSDDELFEPLEVHITYPSTGNEGLIDPKYISSVIELKEQVALTQQRLQESSSCMIEAVSEHDRLMPMLKSLNERLS